MNNLRNKLLKAKKAENEALMKVSQMEVEVKNMELYCHFLIDTLEKKGYEFGKAKS